MSEKSFHYGTANITYWVYGRGRAVVLVHGFAEDGSIWEDHVKQLSAEYKVIIIDLPGSGKSGLIGNGSENDHASIEQLAEVVYEVLKQESETDVTLIGHSMGGYIALAFAEKYPEIMNGLGLFHSSAFADDSEKISTRKKAIDHIRTHGSASFLKTSIPNLFAERFKKNNPEFVEGFINKYSGFNPEALTGYYFAMINRPDRTELLKRFPKPILFIIGEEDAAIPLSASLKQCYLPLQGHVHILPETGHMGMIEEPVKTLSFIKKFCKLVSTGS